MRGIYWQFVGGVLLTSAAHAAPDAWHVSERSGVVTILHAGTSHVALMGAEVNVGDVVATGVSGRAVLVRGEDYLVVAPATQLRVAEPTPANPLLQVLQDAGNVIYKIKHLVTPHFAVSTPYLAAVVKGTTFSITVTEQGTAVQVIDGALKVQTNDGGASELVRPGMIAQVSASSRYQLSIGGDHPHVITSPNAPKAIVTPGTTVSAAKAPTTQGPATAPNGASGSNSTGNPVITSETVAAFNSASFSKYPFCCCLASK